MRQRLGLAQALLGDPELLVLDEPTVGLDPEQRMRFRDLVSEAGRGRTVVLSTHQTEDVAAVCSERRRRQGRAQPCSPARPPSSPAWPRAGCGSTTHRDPRAVAGWRVGAGHYHHVGDPPAGAEVIDPTIEDAYLLLLGPQAGGEGMGEVA